MENISGRLMESIGIAAPVVQPMESIGIAAPVVQALTEKALEILEKEAQYGFGFIRVELHEMVDNLQTVKHLRLLEDKENLNLTIGFVKPVLIRLRNLIYKADDVLTDCLMRVDEYSKNGLSIFLCQYNPFSRKQTGKKLIEINYQMKNCVKILLMYLQKPENSYNGGDDQSEYDRELILSSQSDSVTIGSEMDIKMIKQWIFYPNKELLHRIGIVEMGGMAKTTIAQEIFNDSGISSRFKMLWVTVSKDFSRYRILKRMVEMLGGKIPDEKSDNPINLFGELRKALKVDESANYLVIMDDVRSIDSLSWWDNLCLTLSLPNRSSTIIITTRYEKVAEAIVGEWSRIFRRRTLDREESWFLFSKFAFRSSGGICPDAQFERVGRKIVDQCCGIRLSLKTMGSLLASERRLSSWKEVLKSFHNYKSPIFERYDSVIHSLRLSYNKLEPHLQQCLLCFSIYPQDFEISAAWLIHWWVAEGLIIQKKQDSMSILDLGHKYLSKLISTCLVEVVDHRGHHGRVQSCKIPSAVRELIITIAEEEEFCFFDKQSTQVWNKDSYWVGFTDEMKLPSFRENTKLRALLLLRASYQAHWYESLGLLPFLRVLDLSGCRHCLDVTDVKNLLDWIGSLKRLACLNLSGVEGLNELPSSICKLFNLQLLVLTGCTNLKKLSPSITKLNKLIVLHVGGCPLDYVPCGLERLSNLQELIGFKVVSRTNAQVFGLLDLKKLTQLSVLQIVLSNDDIEISESELSKIFSELKNLKVLDIDADKCTRVRVLEKVDSLGPPENLEELYLRNFHRQTLPTWVVPSKLKNLKYLYIEDAKSITNLIPKDESGYSEYVFEVLEGLCLINLPMLEVDRKDMEKAFPQLRHVKVTCCPNLKIFPHNIDQDTRSGSQRKEVEELID